MKRRSAPFRFTGSKVDLTIFVVGLICAGAAGVAAYRIVGPYGDGPLNVGLYRAEDPETGRQLVYREVTTADGGRLRYFFDDETRKLVEVRALRDGGQKDARFRPGGGAGGELLLGGRSVAWDSKGLVRLGFSLRDNGVIDAWEYRDSKGHLQKIEVSRQQNGIVDRWEFYENGQLARVEEDENRDGRVDRWLTYEAGILLREARDRDGDGRPDTSR